MTLNYFAYLVSLFWTGTACLILGIYQYYRLRTRLAAAYLGLCLVFGSMVIFYCLTASVSIYTFAWYSYYLALLGLLLVFPYFLHFCLILTGREFKGTHLLYLPSFLAFLIFLYSPYFHTELKALPVGYFASLRLFAPVYALYYLCYFLPGLYLIWRSYWHSSKSYERIQARIIMAACIVPFIVGTLLDQVMSALGRPHITFSFHLTALSIALIGYILFRYSPIRQLKKGQVAESAAAAISQGLFMTDPDDRISFVNQSALKLLDRRAHQVVGHKLPEFITAGREGLTTIHPLHGVRPIYVELKLTLLPEGRGKIYLARDLSPVRVAQQEVRRLNEDLRRALAKENELEKWISVFAGLIDEKQIREAWQKLKAEEPGLVEVLQPVYKNVLEQAEAFEEAGQAQKQLNKKIDEVNWLSHFMSGREDLIKELQAELRSLTL